MNFARALSSTVLPTLQLPAGLSSMWWRSGCAAAEVPLLLPAHAPLLTAVRHKIRALFPRPSEVKRQRRHGWHARMSTPSGRRVIMRRMLKGRHVLSH